MIHAVCTFKAKTSSSKPWVADEKTRRQSCEAPLHCLESEHSMLSNAGATSDSSWGSNTMESGLKNPRSRLRGQIQLPDPITLTDQHETYIPRNGILHKDDQKLFRSLLPPQHCMRWSRRSKSQGAWTRGTTFMK